MPWCWARCQAMVSGPASRPWLVRSRRSWQIRSAVAWGMAAGERLGRREGGSKAASPSRWKRATRRADPALGDAVGAGDLTLRSALENDGGDDETGLRHRAD